MIRYLPFLLGFAALVAVAVYDGQVNHRWSRNLEAARYAEVLKADSLKTLGPWEGKDSEVDETIRIVAGAKGYISRSYTNSQTGEMVDVWMIVGPYKSAIRHTPDICYPASGSAPQDQEGHYTFDVPGEPVSDFRTNVFENAQTGQRARVFWSWHKPNASGEVVWDAGSDARRKYATTPALFKLYFTCRQQDLDEPLEEVEANDFAKLFLPAISKLLTDNAPAE